VEQWRGRQCGPRYTDQQVLQFSIDKRRPLYFTFILYGEKVKSASHVSALSIVLSPEGGLEVLGGSFYSVQSLGWKTKEGCVVGKVKITGVYVTQHTLGILISYFREG